MKHQEITDAYARLKNLKLVGKELGIPWQTVYVKLREDRVSVVGDKHRYGSDKDRLAATAESEFQSIIPWAHNNNKDSFQPKVDFTVGTIGVDVKSSRLHKSNARYKSRRWSFSVKKQEMAADFIVCFAYSDDGASRILLIPCEIIRKYQTVSIGEKFDGMWSEFEVSRNDLPVFFREVYQKARTRTKTKEQQ